MSPDADFEETVILGLSTRLKRVDPTGAAAVPPVVVLHGWGAHIEAVSPIVAALASSSVVVAVDLPGFGETAAPPEAWGVSEYARFVLALADHCDFPRFSVVGHSFGARIAIHLASGPSADRVCRLVLTGAAGIKPRRKPFYYAKVGLAKVGRFVAFVGREPGHRLQKRLRGRVASQDWLDASETMRGTFRKVIKEDLKDRLSRVSTPTLLIWGATDAETPLWMGRTMEKLIPNAGLVTLAGAGHYAYADQPGRFNAAVHEFLVSQLSTPARAVHR